jgi:Serine dehydrogenase proteinase
MSARRHASRSASATVASSSGFRRDTEKLTARENLSSTGRPIPASLQCALHPWLFEVVEPNESIYSLSQCAIRRSDSLAETLGSYCRFRAAVVTPQEVTVLPATGKQAGQACRDLLTYAPAGHSARGPDDPQLGRYPAASIVTAANRPGRHDDQTLILADMAAKASLHVRVRHGQPARASAAAATGGPRWPSCSGCAPWTHDHRLNAEPISRRSACRPGSEARTVAS